MMYANRNRIFLTIKDKQIDFNVIPLKFIRKDTSSIYFNYANKTLSEALKVCKNSKLKPELIEKYENHFDKRLGTFLKLLKESNDSNYKHFLNKYGDNKFCEFKIENYLSDKGIYCFIVNDSIKYIGRCADSFKKRFNQGYGKIYPANCLITGRNTNCRINSLINSAIKIKLGIHPMTNKSKDEIKKLEKTILTSYSFDWNIQTS